MFHTPSISKTQKQVNSMGIPIIVQKTKGKKEIELKDLENSIREAKKKYKIEGIITGAVESIYQASRIQKICYKLNLECFNPLWQKNQLELLSDLIENKFEITVRDVTEKDIRHFQHEVHGEVEIINYFDEQRFSDNNIEIGRALVKKDFRKAAQLVAAGSGDYNRAVLDYLSENATDFVGGLRLVPRKILLLLLHSYQSWLWNEMVAAYVMENVSELSLRKYAYGTFAFHCEKLENRKVPIVGFGTEISGDLKKFADEVLAREKITARDFIIREIPELSAEGGERDLMVCTTGFKYAVADDTVKKKVMLFFSLLKGSYAGELRNHREP